MKNWIFTCYLLFGLFTISFANALTGNPPDIAAISNPQNPYDKFGLLHNQGLDAIKSLPGFPCVDPVDRYQAYMDFVKSKYPEVNYSYEKMGRLFDETSQFTQMTPDAVVAELVKRGRISDAVAPYLQQMYSTLHSYGSEHQSPEALAEELISLENQLMATIDAEFDQPSTENEVSLILANSAIARYSYAYWYAVDTNENDGWNTILDGGCGPRSGDDIDDGEIQGKGGKFWKKLVKIWTDTVAFLSNDCDGDFVPELICRFANAGAASASCCK